MPDHVVMFSGGIASWAVARRVADEHGTDRMTLLFADTLRPGSTSTPTPPTGDSDDL